MHKGRLEAFSDGVIAILITIMVLELKTPTGTDLSSLLELRYVGLCYVMSFIYLGIYWNNHHHLFQSIKHVNGIILWANIHTLFWLSLIPFVTAWAGEHHFANLPTACYGIVLLMSAMSYFLLTRLLLATEGTNSVLAKAIEKDFKGKFSVIAYAVSIPIAFYYPAISLFVYFLVALIWLIPDKRIEHAIKNHPPV
jgi:uncharacterized membrane protein